MKQYLNLVARILAEGELRDDRTGVGTLAVFGANLEFDLRERFPLVTAKETRWLTAFLEMLFFLSGQTNVKWLNERGSKLWDAWADENGNLGPVYGFNWRRWGARPDNIPQPKPRLRDGVEATYLGIGNGAGKGESRFGKTWEGMMGRCYDPKNISYKSYGARGVHVCDRWLEFRAFAGDLSNLPGYCLELGRYRKVLDKDILGDGFRYAPETCCFVSDKENASAKAEWLYVVRRNGEGFAFTNVSEFCDEHGIEPKNFSDLWTGNKNAKRRDGFEFVSRTPLRKEFDQVKTLIEGLRTNPHGRRHIVTSWNVGELDRMALPPCHHTHQCYVSNDGHLDLKLFMRSSDVALGLPFNVAAYALLTHLYARAANLKPRRLLVDIGDAHLYSNHVEKMRQVLGRDIIRDEAQLVILTDNTDIDGYKLDDFHIKGYRHHPFVKMEVAV
jgi:thymidylate synthase